MREDEMERLSARNVLQGDTVQGFAAIYTKYRTTRDVSTVGERLSCDDRHFGYLLQVTQLEAGKLTTVRAQMAETARNSETARWAMGLVCDTYLRIRRATFSPWAAGR